MGYKVGDMVVYPRHGAAKVEAITERTVRGVTREYLQLSVLSSDGLVINVPVDNVKKVGVRDIVDANEVSKVFEILRTPIIEKEMNRSRRYKLNVEKIASGDVNKIAEVINRDLKSNIRSMSLNSSGGTLSGLINIEVTSTQVVDAVIYSLMRIKGVQKVLRVNN